MQRFCAHLAPPYIHDRNGRNSLLNPVRNATLSGFVIRVVGFVYFRGFHFPLSLRDHLSGC